MARGPVLCGLNEVGLVDELEGQADGATLEVHDWWEIQRQYVLKAEKDAERKRNERSRRAAVTQTGAVTSRGQSADGRADVPRDGARTRRDETRRDETRQGEDPRVAEATPPAPLGELFESPRHNSRHPHPPPPRASLPRPRSPRSHPTLDTPPPSKL
jgi:hypothetical protein